MSLSFPSNPNLNDTVTLSNKTYVWNGNAWKISSYQLPLASKVSPGAVQVADGGGIDVSNSGIINSVGAQLYLWANFR